VELTEKAESTLRDALQRERERERQRQRERQRADAERRRAEQLQADLDQVREAAAETAARPWWRRIFGS